jgi:hypothetical protein
MFGGTGSGRRLVRVPQVVDVGPGSAVEVGHRVTLSEFLPKSSKRLFRRLLQEALQELIEDELTAAIGAARHERTDTRTNQRNGGRDKTLSAPV